MSKQLTNKLTHTPTQRAYRRAVVRPHRLQQARVLRGGTGRCGRLAGIERVDRRPAAVRRGGRQVEGSSLVLVLLMSHCDSDHLSPPYPHSPLLTPHSSLPTPHSSSLTPLPPPHSLLSLHLTLSLLLTHSFSPSTLHSPLSSFLTLPTPHSCSELYGPSTPSAQRSAEQTSPSAPPATC
jgi:hypothetical protein